MHFVMINLINYGIIFISLEKIQMTCGMFKEPFFVVRDKHAPLQKKKKTNLKNLKG